MLLFEAYRFRKKHSFFSINDPVFTPVLSVVVYYSFTVWVSVLGPLNADANTSKLSLHLDQTLQSPPRT